MITSINMLFDMFKDFIHFKLLPYLDKLINLPYLLYSTMLGMKTNSFGIRTVFTPPNSAGSHLNR